MCTSFGEEGSVTSWYQKVHLFIVLIYSDEADEPMRIREEFLAQADHNFITLHPKAADVFIGMYLHTTTQGC